MPRISVVVPIYNVERYLAACLDSVARQTIEDLEVIMVDDGSTDASARIAAELATRDPRFRLVSQPNAGLGAARNTGADAARGEFLSFVDSDDALPPNAYELLLGALERSGSDFATGNVHSLTRIGTRQADFLADAFSETRLNTHVTRFRPLIADRIAPNKLFRRSFWNLHGLRFPEGVVHEDIPVIVPAHFMARSVDVIAEPVYLYRSRRVGEGAQRSITQRRLEPRVLLDRLAAIEHVRRYLDREGPREGRRWYEESVVADDLLRYVDVLQEGDDGYRALFLDRVNALLDGADDGIYDPLPAIQRLKWHLVRRRMLPELLEVREFERAELAYTRPVREGRHWYGDYPFRTDRARGIPRSVYRVDDELDLSVTIADVHWEDDRLKVGGWAFIDGIGAPDPGSQRITVTAQRPRRWHGLPLPPSVARFDVTPVARPEVTANERQGRCDLTWSGFEATLAARDVLPVGRTPDGLWDFTITVRAGGVTRSTGKVAVPAERPLRVADTVTSDAVRVIAKRSPDDDITLQTQTRWAIARRWRLADGVLELAGELCLPGEAELVVSDRRRARTRRYPIALERGTRPAQFTARVPLAELEGAEGWLRLYVMAEGRRDRLAMAQGADGVPGSWAGRQVMLARGERGGASLVVRPPRPRLTDARWTDDGALELAGELALPGRHELVLAARDRVERHVVGARDDGGRFEARVTPPPGSGTWDVGLRPAGDAEPPAPTEVAAALDPRLPLSTVVAHRPLTLGVTRRGQPLLIVRRDLDDDERGPYHQRRLQRTAYAARLGEPLQDAVVYASFGGREYSDGPRAIHEELVRRGAPLEHLWVVRDALCEVPDSARVVRQGSRAHHEALARARYFVTNDHFPRWFVRRDDQVCVQTWHGTPLKRLGLDVSRTWGASRFERRWREQVRNWQYVVSPNRFSTPILRQAFALEGEVLETGYPRLDVLLAAGREERARAVRRRLGIPDGQRVVLYAPTCREDVVDAAKRYRLDLQLDFERLRGALGDDTALLFRRHPLVVDGLPAGAERFVRDVSTYPDAIELLLAVDVLITDYSSLMVDFASTGRPILLYAYDLESYREEVRGFYLDLADEAPGPLLGTTADVAEALNDLDAVRAAQAERYEAFRSTFCALDDGAAAARVVDRIMGESTRSTTRAAAAPSSSPQKVLRKEA